MGFARFKNGANFWHPQVHIFSLLQEAAEPVRISDSKLFIHFEDAEQYAIEIGKRWVDQTLKAG